MDWNWLNYKGLQRKTRVKYVISRGDISHIEDIIGFSIADDNAAARARAAGLDVIMNQCMKVQHSRWSSTMV